MSKDLDIPVSMSTVYLDAPQALRCCISGLKVPRCYISGLKVLFLHMRERGGGSGLKVLYLRLKVLRCYNLRP